MMAAMHGVATLSRFEVASPFLVSALLLFLAPFVARAIELSAESQAPVVLRF